MNKTRLCGKDKNIPLSFDKIQICVQISSNPTYVASNKKKHTTLKKQLFNMYIFAFISLEDSLISKVLKVHFSLFSLSHSPSESLLTYLIEAETKMTRTKCILGSLE